MGFKEYIQGVAQLAKGKKSESKGANGKCSKKGTRKRSTHLEAAQEILEMIVVEDTLANSTPRTTRETWRTMHKGDFANKDSLMGISSQRYIDAQELREWLEENGVSIRIK